MNEGWICPRCKKVNAPDVKACDCKFEKSIIDELKKLKPIPKETVNIPNYPNHYCPRLFWYPDWTYRPPYWFPATTTTGGTSEYIK